MKKCRKCGEEKPNTNEFFPWKNKAKGWLTRHCKSCENAINSEKWKNRSPENEEKRKERDRLRAAKKRLEDPDYFKAIEEKRKKSLAYRVWRDHQREANKAKSFLKNIGSFCDISPIKCRVCESLQVKRGKSKSNICKPCWRKSLFNLGRSIKQKEVLCRCCGVLHIAKKVSSLCPDCSSVRALVAKRKGKRIARSVRRFTQRCEKYGVVYTKINRPDVFNRDNWTCVYCGVRVVRTKHYAPNQATLDHVIPLSKGGTHTMDNVVTACQQCNSVKSNKDVLMIKKTKQLVMWMR